MSPFFRGTLFGAGIVAALVASYCVGRNSNRTPEVAPAAVAVTSSPRTEKPVALGPSPSEPAAVPIPIADTAPLPEPDIVVAGLPVSRSQATETPAIPTLELDNIPPPSPNDPVNPNDPTFQFIANQIGIKPRILDKQESLPPVLADAKKDLPPTLPQIDLPPIPMMAPKLDIPVPLKPCKLLNTREVAIDFETTRTGSTRIVAVELWTTLDGGLTWSCTDRMVGNRSPFRTRLGSEGVYGFKLVFENELGLRSAEPKQGDTPDTFVELDLKSPRVSAVKVDAIAGQIGKVQLSWTVFDKHEDRRSAKLEYSTDGCDWQTIDVTALRRADERFEVDWSLPAGVPSQVQFRVSARDLAGNQTVSESANKMTIDLVAPEGKVTGVRSDRTEPEIGPMPRLVGVRDGVRCAPADRDDIRSAKPGNRGGNERKLINILADTDWKPSTATPESYQLWEHKPRDPMWHWGLPSGIEFTF